MHEVTRGETIRRHRRAEGARALRRNKLFVLLIVLGFVLSACGTRLPDSAFVKAQQGSNASNQSAAGDAGGATTDAGTTGETGDQGGTAASTGQTGGSAGSAGSKCSGGGAAAAAGGGGAGGPNTASDVGVTPTSIKIGNITSVQGQFGPDAFSGTLYGLQSYVNAINARGGINGRKIDFKTCDDRDTGDGNL